MERIFNEFNSAYRKKCREIRRTRVATANLMENIDKVKLVEANLTDTLVRIALFYFIFLLEAHNHFLIIPADTSQLCHPCEAMKFQCNAFLMGAGNVASHWLLPREGQAEE